MEMQASLKTALLTIFGPRPTNGQMQTQRGITLKLIMSLEAGSYSKTTYPVAAISFSIPAGMRHPAIIGIGN